MGVGGNVTRTGPELHDISDGPHSGGVQPGILSHTPRERVVEMRVLRSKVTGI